MGVIGMLILQYKQLFKDFLMTLVLNGLKRLGAVLLLSHSIISHASLSTYTDSTAFYTAISGYSTSTLNFDSATAGDLISDGDTLGGITFDYSSLALDGVSMQIRDDYPAYTGDKYLGTDDGGTFLGGDGFSLSFGASNAIGLFFLSGDELYDSDISFTVGTTAVFLSSSFESELSDGSYVHFLGLVDDSDTFSDATVSSSCSGCFFFNVDGITTATVSISAVPVPAALWLFLSGLMSLLLKTRISTVELDKFSVSRR